MIEIREVKSRCDLKKFVQFPRKLYKGNPYYVPEFDKDEIANFTPSKNPAYEFCETKLFLAYKDGELVGRVAGLINHAYIKKVNQNLIRFTRLDMIDDLEVTRALLNAVREWGASRGIFALMGPIGFTDLDLQGMLIKGFDEMDMMITIYNHAYYPKHMEALGFEKDVDWIEYLLTIPEAIDPKIERLSKLVQRRYGYRRLKVKGPKDVMPYAHAVLQIVNQAYLKLYGTVPLTDAVIQQAIDEYFPMMDPDLAFIIVDKNDEAVGFGLAFPSIVKALQAANGKIGLISGIKLLKALKNYDTVELFFIAVKPELQNTGISAIILDEGFKAMRELGVKYAETGPELEMNYLVQKPWDPFEKRQHRSRRCYIKTFEAGEQL